MGMEQHDLVVDEVDPGGQEVVFWHQYRGDRKKAINALIDKFNSSNAHAIKVKGEYIGNYNAIYNKMLVAFREATCRNWSWPITTKPKLITTPPALWISIPI